MRHPIISFLVAVILLALFTAAGCGGDSSSGAGSNGTGGSGGSGGAGGSSDPCAGHTCGDPCSTCPEGAPCMPQACNADGACVEESLAVCSPCPSAPPTDGDRVPLS